MDFVAVDLFPGDDPSSQPVGWLPPRSRKGPPVAAESRFYATDHHSPSGQLSKKADEKLEEKKESKESGESKESSAKTEKSSEKSTEKSSEDRSEKKE